MSSKTEINRSIVNDSTMINQIIENKTNQTIVNPNVSDSSERIEEGTCLLSKYTIIKSIDTLSGEADLYLCEYYGDTYVAKIYRREVAIKPEVVQALKNIKSPYVARLFDSGVYNGKPFEILPYYKQGSIQGKLFSFDQLKNMIIPCINEALNQLHKIGVIHKDLKPSNIMLLDDNTGVAIIDFGISSIINDGNTVLVTKTGMTPEYSAPETFYNVYLDESDYYSMGITLYELFCGHTPYSNMSADEITRYMSVQKIPFPNNMPESLCNLIIGLTYGDLTNRNNKDNPNRRWTYDEVSKWCNGIEQALPGTGTSATIPSYKFNGHSYTKMPELMEALATDWGNGKKQLYRGLLSGFFMACDTEIANLCMDAEERVSKNIVDEDFAFWELVYAISPKTEAFYWKGRKYSSLKNLGEEMMTMLRGNDCSNVDFWNDILTNRLISLFMDIHKYPKNIIKGIAAIESEIILQTTDITQAVRNYYLCAYMLTGEKNYIISGLTFSSIETLAEYMNTLLSKSFEKFDSFCRQLMQANYNLDPQFEAWLMSLGKSKEITEWKNALS